MTGYRRSISKGSGSGGGEGTLPDPVTLNFTEYWYDHSSWPYEETTTETEVTLILSDSRFRIIPWPDYLPVEYPEVEIGFDTLPDVTDYMNTEFPITYESSVTDNFTGFVNSMDIHIIPVDYVEESEGQEGLFQKAYSGDIGFSEFDLYDYPVLPRGGEGEGETKTSIQLRRPKSYVKLNGSSKISKVAVDPNPGFTVGGNYPGILDGTVYGKGSPLFPELCVYPETLLANKMLYLWHILNRPPLNYYSDYISFVAGKHLCNHPHGLFVDLAGVGGTFCYVLFKFFITLKVGD